MKKLRVTVEGKMYEVLVETIDESSPVATPAPVTSASVASAPVAPVAAPAAPKKVVAGGGDVTSPLSGKLVSIDVKQGQTVAEGQQVATIEAMKMNTYIYAPKAGSVVAILSNAGDAVEEGSVLLRIG